MTPAHTPKLLDTLFQVTLLTEVDYQTTLAVWRSTPLLSCTLVASAIPWWWLQLQVWWWLVPGRLG